MLFLRIMFSFFRDYVLLVPLRAIVWKISIITFTLTNLVPAISFHFRIPVLCNILLIFVDLKSSWIFVYIYANLCFLHHIIRFQFAVTYMYINFFLMIFPSSFFFLYYRVLFMGKAHSHENSLCHLMSWWKSLFFIVGGLILNCILSFFYYVHPTQ